MGYPKIEKRANEIASQVCELWQQAGSPLYILPSEGEQKFIESLPESQKLPLLQALEICNGEIASLETEYGITTIAKKLQPLYRKAMTKISGITAYRSLPLALFTFTGTKTVNDDTRSKVEISTEKLYPVTESQLSQWTAKATDFIFCEGEDNYAIAKLALGLAMLTGRRIYKEICIQGEFFPVLDGEGKIDNSRLSFYGQAKAGETRKNQGFDIDCLYNATDCIDAIKDLQDMVKVQSWYSQDSNAVQSVLHTYVEKIILTELLPIFTATNNAGYGLTLNPKDSRKMYATICHNNYVKRTGKNIGFETFTAKLLGHVKTSKTGKQFKDTVTTQSYNKFSVVTGEVIPNIDLYWD